MPNRVLRDELITSERWWSVSAEARTLWVSVFLSADDLGRALGTTFVIRAKYMAGTVTSERADMLAMELMDVDLLRIYVVDGTRYFLIPRFRQRVRYPRGKYPEPPKHVNDLASKKTVQGPSMVSPRTAEREVKVLPNGSTKAKTTPPIIPLKGDEPPKPRKPKKVPIPPDFGISDRVLAWCEKHRVLNVERHFEYFCGYAVANGKVYADWDQALINCIRGDWAKIGDGQKRLAI